MVSNKSFHFRIVQGQENRDEAESTSLWFPLYRKNENLSNLSSWSWLCCFVLKQFKKWSIGMGEILDSKEIISVVDLDQIVQLAQDF